MKTHLTQEEIDELNSIFKVSTNSSSSWSGGSSVSYGTNWYSDDYYRTPPKRKHEWIPILLLSQLS